MDAADILARFDEQIRRRGAPDGLSIGKSWSAVMWPPADGDVEPLVARLRELPGHVEWKYYSHDGPELRERLLAAGSGGRVDFEDGVEFAGLYGGFTLPEFRGRGLYRATVAKRAELARERGYDLLYSDALPRAARSSSASASSRSRRRRRSSSPTLSPPHRG